jgi:hypothetical protein
MSSTTLAAVNLVGRSVLVRGGLRLASLVCLNALKKLEVCEAQHESRRRNSAASQSPPTRLKHALSQGSSVERVRLVAQQVPLRTTSARAAAPADEHNIKSTRTKTKKLITHLDDGVVNDVAAAWQPNGLVHEGSHDGVQKFICTFG